MAIWSRILPCPIPGDTAAFAGTLAASENAVPDRTGRLRTGSVCVLEFDPCPDMPMPPDEGAEGVLDIYLCRSETVS